MAWEMLLLWLVLLVSWLASITINLHGQNGSDIQGLDGRKHARADHNASQTGPRHAVHCAVRLLKAHETNAHVYAYYGCQEMKQGRARGRKKIFQFVFCIQFCTSCTRGGFLQTCKMQNTAKFRNPAQSPGKIADHPCKIAGTLLGPWAIIMRDEGLHNRLCRLKRGSAWTSSSRSIYNFSHDFDLIAETNCNQKADEAEEQGWTAPANPRG